MEAHLTKASLAVLRSPGLHEQKDFGVQEDLINIKDKLLFSSD